MRFYYNFFLILLLFSSSCNRSVPENVDRLEVPKLYLAHFTNIPPKIDGLQDSTWEQAQWSDSFIDIEGTKIPKYDTQVKMLWDAHALYILTKLEEPHIWGNLIQRDTVIFYNNDFEVFIDPDGDTHDYMELEINALNTVWDLFLKRPYRNKVKVDNQWNIETLLSAVSYQGSLNNPSDTDQGWQLEIALPWESLRRGNLQGSVPINQFWRINFSRVNWEHALNNDRYDRKKDVNGNYLPEYNWVWSPQGAINMHMPELWGYVFFTDRKEQKISAPEDAQLIQWMYGHYREKLALEKKNLDIDQMHYALYKNQHVKFEKRIINDTLYWTTFNPENQKTYRIRYDGKFQILD